MADTTDKMILAVRPIKAAEALDVSRSKVYEMLASGELPSIEVGGCKRIPLQVLQELINRKLATAQQDIGDEQQHNANLRTPAKTHGR